MDRCGNCLKATETIAGRAKFLTAKSQNPSECPLRRRWLSVSWAIMVHPSLVTYSPFLAMGDRRPAFHDGRPYWTGPRHMPGHL
jgi:hypothetical protein